MSNYPVVYSHNNAAGAGAGSTIDLAVACNTDFPPVMIVTCTGVSALVLIQGSHDNANWVDFSSGGFSITPAAGIAKDLVPGVRYWRTYILTVNGAVTSGVGAYPTAGGGFASPSAPAVATDVAAGQ